jgi:GNAT superfamily N-acetyltransferase
MGVLPAARGHGWGAGIVRYAQWLAGQAARGRLVLAVDAANAPALRMYAAAGFRQWDQTSVFLRIFDRNGPMERS